MVDLTALDATAQQQQRTIIRDPNVFTTREYYEKLGISRNVAAPRLAALAAAGVITRTRVQMLINGGVQSVSGWKFVGKSAESKGASGRNRSKGSGSGGSKRSGRR